ncbi:MAG: hypothetical protein ACI959_002092 [Limisphaerales bacterium]|jgi:hypothetical protein
MEGFPLEEYCKQIWNVIEKPSLSFESVSIELGRYIFADSTLLLAIAN